MQATYANRCLENVLGIMSPLSRVAAFVRLPDAGATPPPLALRIVRPSLA
jgi:hypothetical protein